MGGRAGPDQLLFAEEGGSRVTAGLGVLGNLGGPQGGDAQWALLTGWQRLWALGAQCLLISVAMAAVGTGPSRALESPPASRPRSCFQMLRASSRLLERKV